jgi:shikimate dehydrogenase
MPREFNFLSKLTGCFSQPAAGNPTVAMIEAAYRHHGLNWRYINCEVTPESLGDAVRGARAMRWAGFNCSLPDKVAVIEHLDGLGDSAAIMRAVNCAVRRGSKYVGENTDGKGFLMSLEGIIDPRGRRVVLFGAGGAARAIGVELALAGAYSISVVNRSAGRGAELVRLIKDNTSAKAEPIDWERKYSVQPDADIVINATSIGRQQIGALLAGGADAILLETMSDPAEAVIGIDVRIVGGCCGTTSEHLLEISRALKGL